MQKIVRYKGGELSYYGCTGDCKKLRRGSLYMVVDEEVRPWQTDYTLHGLEGGFNSVWFETVYELKTPANLVWAPAAPIIGQRYRCRKVSDATRGGVVCINTSPVKAVKRIGINLYLATTCNSVYFVQVG